MRKHKTFAFSEPEEVVPLIAEYCDNCSGGREKYKHSINVDYVKYLKNCTKDKLNYDVHGLPYKLCMEFKEVEKNGIISFDVAVNLSCCIYSAMSGLYFNLILKEKNE